MTESSAGDSTPGMPCWLGRKTDDGTVQVSPGHRPLGRCCAEGIDAAVTAGDPVALAVRRGRQGHDVAMAIGGRCRTEVAGVTEGEDAAVGGHQPVALAVRRGRHADDRLVEVEVAGRAVEGGVAEAEDAAVGGHQPVALAVGRGRHADDRLVQVQVAGRAVEGGVAEAEDAAVGGHQPVALAVGRGRHADDRLVQVQVAGRAVEGGVAEAEDAAVGGHQPVALAVGGGRHADDRLVQVEAAGRTEVAGVTEGEDAAVGGHQPVALAVGGGRVQLVSRLRIRILPGRLHSGAGGECAGRRGVAGRHYGRWRGRDRTRRGNRQAEGEGQEAEEANDGDPRPTGATASHPGAGLPLGHTSVRPGGRRLDVDRLALVHCLRHPQVPRSSCTDVSHASTVSANPNSGSRAGYRREVRGLPLPDCSRRVSSQVTEGSRNHLVRNSQARPTGGAPSDHSEGVPACRPRSTVGSSSNAPVSAVLRSSSGRPCGSRRAPPPPRRWSRSTSSSVPMPPTRCR